MSQTPHSILAIDDNPDNLALVEFLLQSDYKIYSASSGESGLKKSQQHKPDLILLDLIMPGMDGFHVLVELKRNPATRHIPIIILSSLCHSNEEIKGLSLGAVDYISKPFTPTLLKLRVQLHLKIVAQHQKIQQLAHQDHLTKLNNRRYFDQQLDLEIKHSSRGHTPLSLALIDIDHFKLYNDHFGHVKGDKVLRQVADELTKNLQRDTDLIARYGGEEFVLVLPHTHKDGAIQLCKKLIQAIYNLSITHPLAQPHQQITISVGGYSYYPHQQQWQASEFINQADKQLYQAKSNGRHQVCWASG